MDKNLKRLVTRQPSGQLSEVLSILTGYLDNIHLSEAAAPEPDCLLICGAPRSGTSLLLQYLADTGLFAYPSNIISRFYSAPYVGELVGKLLLEPECDYRGEFEDLRKDVLPIDFRSDLGKTKNVLGVNEFWFFWRRFFSVMEKGVVINAEDWETCRGPRFWQEILEWQNAAQKPIAMKGLMANFSINIFLERNRNCRILNIYRSPVDNMISLLNARISFYGNVDAWYSFSLPDYVNSGSLPEEQVAVQVAFNQLYLEKVCELFPDERICSISYEEFCIDPSSVLKSRPVRKMFISSSDGVVNMETASNLKFKPHVSSIAAGQHKRFADRNYMHDVFSREYKRLKKMVYVG